MTARSLAASIRRRQTEGLLPVLSEIKVRSPKEGDLLRGRAPETLAAAMATAPIAGLSVVTEAADFGGDLDIVRRVRPLVRLTATAAQRAGAGRLAHALCSLAFSYQYWRGVADELGGGEAALALVSKPA